MLPVLADPGDSILPAGVATMFRLGYELQTRLNGHERLRMPLVAIHGKVLDTCRCNASPAAYNCRMASENPYQSPAIPAELLQPEWPAAGVFSDGHYLVLHHTSTLPPICVKTGLPAEIHVPADLVGGLPNDDSVPATRRKWYGDNVYTIQVPLSYMALRLLDRVRAAGLIVAGATFLAMTLIAIFYVRLQELGLADVAPVCCVIGLIASVALLTESRHHLRLECVARGYFWIANPSKEYLRELPPWPVPCPRGGVARDFGPAGLSGAARQSEVRIAESL